MRSMHATAEPSRLSPVLAPALVGLLLVALLACTGPQEPEFRRLERLRFQGLAADGSLRLTAEAVFENPNGFALQATSLELQVFVEEQEAASIRFRRPCS
jgi:hypothetical protein